MQTLCAAHQARPVRFAAPPQRARPRHGPPHAGNRPATPHRTARPAHARPEAAGTPRWRSSRSTVPPGPDRQVSQQQSDSFCIRHTASGAQAEPCAVRFRKAAFSRGGARGGRRRDTAAPATAPVESLCTSHGVPGCTPDTGARAPQRW